MKRLFGILSVLLLLGSMAWAAGGQEAPEAAEKVKLSWWTWVEWNETIQTYQKGHPNIQVEFTRMGPWDLHDKFLVSLAAGEGAADVVQLVQRRFPSYSSTGKLADMTPYVKDLKKDFQEGTWNVGLYQGKVYGLASDIGPGVLWFRKDLFDKVGVQSVDTISDYETAGRKLKTAGHFLMPAFYPSGGWGVNAFNIFLHSKGGNIYTKEGKVITNNPELKATLEWFYRLYFEEELIKGIKFFSTEFWAAFKEGVYASWPMNTAEGRNIKKFMPDLSGKWSVAPFPRWSASAAKTTGVWGGSEFCVAEHCKNKKEAIEFIKWLCGTVEGQIAISKEQNFFPGFQPALKDPYYAQSDPYFGGANIYAQARDKPNYYYWDWAKTEQIVGKRLDLMFGGDSAAETYQGIINDLKRELNR